MSKAFTRETDTDDEEEFEEEEQSLPKGTKNYITPAGYARLEAELRHLLEVERPEVVKVVSWAAGLGDRSENADYIYGKKRLREIDKRIRFLTKRLGFAQIVDPVQQPHDRIYFGATVVVADAEGREATYTIVGIDELDPARGRISWRSPLALALLGKEEGETVTVRTPSGVQELEILEVRYEAVD
jgi:transcription elongation factor GreB